MRRKIISAFLLLFLFSAITPVAFAHSATLQIGGEGRYKAIRLTPEIYNNANSDLSDILIKNSQDEPVPYFINTGFQRVSEIREAYAMVLIDAFTKEDHFFFDYKLTTERERDTVATSIEVSTHNTDFAKSVDIYGSYDNLYWEFVQKDKLYAIDNKAKFVVEFNKPQKYTHYRFELTNNLEKISFDAVNLIYSATASEKSYFIETLLPAFTVEEKDKTTHISIDGLKNLRLCDITIETDSMFKRNAFAPRMPGKELYHLSLNDTSYTDTTLPLNWQISQENTYVITIANNDDKPIDVKGIVVHYYVDEVVFEGTANERYSLDFGQDAAKTAPVYDIERYKDEILKSAIDKAIVGPINYAEEKEKPAERDYKFIFNIVVIGTTILLGGLIFLRLKRTR